MDEKNKRLQEILSDEELAKEVLSIEKPEDAQKWFADHGIDYSMDEIMWLGELFRKAASGEITQKDVDMAENGELSGEMLRLVSGGAWTTVDTVMTAVSVVAAVGSGLLKIAICAGCW